MESSCPPPRRFNAAVEVRSAKFLTEQPPFISRGRATGRFAVGVRYERKAQEYLGLVALGLPTVVLRHSPWIEFLDKSGRRWCQPDALLTCPEEKTGIICEIKYQHTSDAWWQLKHLYAPVLERALPGYRFALVEIVHWFDPATAFPERYERVRHVWPLQPSNLVRVHVYNPRRLERLLAARPGGG